MIKKLIVSFVLLSIGLPVAAQEVPLVQGSAVKIGELRAAAKEKVAAEREEYKNKVADARAELKEKVDAARSALKDRFAAIKDEKKKQAVMRVESQLAELNTRRAAHFTNVLKQTNEVLVRVGERVAKSKSAGSNVSGVESLVTTANQAITKAQDAVKAQSAKMYVAAVDSDAKLRESARSLRESLRKDLEVVRDAVKVARNAVHDVAVALAKVPKVENPTTPVVPAPGAPVNQ